MVLWFVWRIGTASNYNASRRRTETVQLAASEQATSAGSAGGYRISWRSLVNTALIGFLKRSTINTTNDQVRVR
jgi:hypothetical protein